MATKKRVGRQPKGGGPNRSEFIRGVLTSNPKATSKDVQDAWSAAGNTQKLSHTLFYVVKGKMGLPKGKRRRGKRAGRPTQAASNGATAASKPSSGGYLEIERTLDGLIAKAEVLNDRKLADDLRQARRRASMALV